MKFTNKESLQKKIVLISGLTRSGKALLCPIISSFNNAEKVNVNFSLEQIPVLNYLGEMKDNVTKFLLQSGMNLSIYDNAIGRNSNFRSDDFTSIWKYRDPLEYINRLTQPDGDIALEKLNSQNRIFSMMVHNGLWHADIWFKAFPDIKFIHISRNPVDIAYSWIGKGYGGDFYSSGRAAIVTYEYKNNTLPYYAFGWEEKYISLSKIDRIIHMINHIRNCHHEKYVHLNNNDKRRVLFINHQKLITKTEECLNTIEDFIGEGPSVDTPSELIKQNCPRSLGASTPFSTSNKNFNEKLKEIENLATSEGYVILKDMLNQFESTKLAI